METTPRKDISLADTAKMIRKELKAVFPDEKFSVRSSRYSMGSSIDVSWTDGPSSGDVNDLIGKYSSKGFDGMTDGTYHYEHWLCPHGVLNVARSYGHSYDNGAVEVPHCEGAYVVSLGAGYVHGQREVSAELRASAIAIYEELTGRKYDDNEYNASRDLWKLLEGTYEVWVGLNNYLTYNALGEITSDIAV